jgi:hypothetical protein
LKSVEAVDEVSSRKVVECVEAHYEVQDVEMGKVYRWCPANVSVECTCGEEPTLSVFRTACGGWRAVTGDRRV